VNAVRGDCLEVAGMIGDHNHELGERLRCMVENLQYKEMLVVLDNLTREVTARPAINGTRINTDHTDVHR
jgi:hypothetical protein